MTEVVPEFQILLKWEPFLHMSSVHTVQEFCPYCEKGGNDILSLEVNKCKHEWLNNMHTNLYDKEWEECVFSNVINCHGTSMSYKTSIINS
jgi:hypothetical protein